MKTYFAIVHKDENSAVGVVFPDLPGCFSAGDTFDKAIANAHVALRAYAEAEHTAGRKLPKPSTFEALYRDREVREEAKGAPFVGIGLDEEREPPARARNFEVGADRLRGKPAPSRESAGARVGAKSKKRARPAG